MKQEETRVGQYNLPSWNKFEKMVDGIWDRKYYTNHGPLLQELETKLSELCNVKHAIGMTNSHIALMISAKALNVEGEVIIPSFSNIMLSQSVIWAGAKPTFTDVEVGKPHIDPDQILLNVNSESSAIFSSNLWGDFGDMERINKIARDNNLKTLYLSEDAFGQSYDEIPCGNYNDVVIFSFEESNIINGADCACVCTNDDELAARIRNIRSSYGSGPKVSIPYTGNGRLSEIQAGLALLSLEDIDENINNNKDKYGKYEEVIKNIPGISLYTASNKVTNQNYQNIVVLIDEPKYGLSAKELSNIFATKNIETLDFSTYGTSPNSPFESISDMPNTSNFQRNALRLPNNQNLTNTQIELIGSIIKNANKK